MVFSVFGATVAFTGSAAAANAPGSSATPAAAGNYDGDNTASVNTLPSEEVLAANIDFSGESGEMENITVDPDGDNSVKLSDGDITNIRVEALNESSVIAENSTSVSTLDTATIDFNGTAADADNGSVDQVKIYMTVASDNQVDGDEDIDAAIEIFAEDGTTFGGSSPYDTAGVQSIRTDTAFITGDVLDGSGQPVANEDGIIEIVNADSDVTVATLDTDAQGNFEPNRQAVAPGNKYTVIVDKTGYTTFSSTKSVSSQETVDFPATIEFNLEADNLRVERFDGSSVTGNADSTLLADGRSDNTAQYAVIVENSSVAEDTTNDIDTSSFSLDVELEFNGSSVVGDFVDNDTSDKTLDVTTTQRGDIDGDGIVESYQLFEVTAQNANESSLLGEPTETNSINATQIGGPLSNSSADVQYVLEGNDVITGEVVTPDEDFGSITVWASYNTANESLAFNQETFSSNGDAFLTDSVTSDDGRFIIDGLALANDTDGEVTTPITLYAVAEEDVYNRLNRTDEAVNQFVAAEYTIEQNTSDGDWTQEGDFFQADQDVVVFEEDVDFEYRLNVTVDDANGEQVKSTDVAQGNTRTVTVDVDQQPIDRGGAWTDADAGKNITVGLTNETEGELGETTLVTDANGEATTTFTAGAAAGGVTNVTASTENDLGDINTTSGSEEAEINVFGPASITGDVVNEDSQNLPGATVELFDPADTDLSDPLVTIESGDEGSYTFSEIDGERLQSGESYVVRATFNGESETRQFNSLSAGTNDGDIAIIGVTPEEGTFEVSELSPTDVTVTQGDEITVSATVTNVGDELDTQDVDFRVGGTTIASETVELSGGENQTVTFENVSTASLGPGNYTHGVFTEDDSQTATLTVESTTGGSGVVDQYDDNGDGAISLLELSEAAGDYSDDQLSLQDLSLVAGAYSNS